ncbi:MAG: hypothetical protein N2557_08515, partial [Hydrogenophilus sp.]|nr:hypothetical protein [Hydrogenophilus sp.]
MPSNRCRIVFDPQSIIDLIVHYTDGQLPLSSEVTGLYNHPHLDRIIAFSVRSPEFDTPAILHFRYQDRKVLV